MDISFRYPLELLPLLINLSELRDTLLPRLMSGKLRITGNRRDKSRK